jgi:hypothetical protein
LSQPFSCVILGAAGEGIAVILVFALNHLVGRTWLLGGRPSLLPDGVDGFNFFRSGPGYETYPSTDIAAVFTIAGVLRAANPKLRLCVAIDAAVAIPLVVGDFHFVPKSRSVHAFPSSWE